jgi:hypothetical protein
MKKRFSPHDLRSIFELIAQCGISTIILGGQAVNIHANSYAPEIPDLEQYGSLTSVDLDLHGGMAEAKALVKLFNPKHFEINHGDGDVNHAGVMSCSIGEIDIVIDVLAHLVGLSGSEILQSSFRYEDVPLPVLHPVQCLMSKTHNVAKLPQTERQDIKHLLIMIHVCQAHLWENIGNSRYVLNQIESISFFSRSVEARKVHREHGIHLLDAIPIEKLRQLNDPKIQIFLEKRWPQVLAAAAQHGRQP